MSAPPALECFSELGRALRILRDRSKLSITVLAGLAEMNKSQISKYESGVELPNLKTLARILDALEVEPLWLFHLMHQLSRQQPGDSLRADLFLAGSGRLLETGEGETFRAETLTMFGFRPLRPATKTQPKTIPPEQVQSTAQEATPAADSKTSEGTNQ